MSLSEFFRLRVFRPFVFLPQGVVGCRPPEDFLKTLGYPYVEETDNPVYRLFLNS